MSSQLFRSDKIWSLIKETREDIKETQKNIKDLFISQKETGDQIRKMSKEIRKAQNLFTTQWGRLMESLMEGDLIRILKERGIEIQRTSTNEKGLMSYIDEKGQKQLEECEIDIVAKNGREIVAVEVKTTLTVRDVRRFLDILEMFIQLLPEYRDTKVYGAVAYLRGESEAKLFAEKQGLFVIRATGNSASIINKEDFRPKAFS